jgi:cytidyltransferase-like protein|tara:strand:- start:5024 stop:5782 length:759 start_codon:yes stop_codon:yes gene_type:complete
MRKKVVLVTGGFDPLHSGHIAYFKAAKTLGDTLIVGLNSDEWLERKKGRAFMPWNERLCIINNLSVVDEVFTFMDDDDTAINFIKQVKAHYPTDKLIFANGGDRTAYNIPEMVVDGVEFEFGVGGKDKINSSSWILEEWKNPKTIREWGWYRVLDTQMGYKVKELVIAPGKSLSNQRHFKRSEHWYVLKGQCALTTEWDDRATTSLLTELTSGYAIGQKVWHQASNNTKDLCHILEVQYGEECVEEDIERRT